MKGLIGFLSLGLFLCYQSFANAGIFGVRLFLREFNSQHILINALSGAVCGYGLFLGGVSVAIGVAFFIENKKNRVEKGSNNRKFYVAMGVVLSILAGVTVL